MNKNSRYLSPVHLFISALLVVLFYFAPAQARSFSCSSPVRIMPLGDSITFGDPDVNNINYAVGYRQPLYLSLIKKHNIRFVGSQQAGMLNTPAFDTHHEGHPGYAATDIANGINGWLSNNPPDIVLLHIGTNDLNYLGADGNIADAVKNAGQILDSIHQFNADIIVVMAKIIDIVDPPAYQGYTAQFNTALEQMANQRADRDRIVIVDMENALDYSTDMLSDGVHPNASGYAKMANVWNSALDQLLPACVAPSITSSPVANATVGQPYSYAVKSDGDPVFALTRAPAGMTIDQNSGIISWTPPAKGNFAVQVSATNEFGTDTQDFTINVAAAIPANGSPTAPNLVSPADGQAGLDTTVTFKWDRSTDPDGNAVTYHLYYSTSPIFASGSQIDIQGRHSTGLGYSLVFLLGFGIFLYFSVKTGRTKKSSLHILVLIPVLTSMMLLFSCGGGGGGNSTDTGTKSDFSQTVSELAPHTAYYWKVSADDGKGGITESETRSFVTK